nr:hypothetical protein Iba_chr04cCG15060 [Ipomoea batatas]
MVFWKGSAGETKKIAEKPFAKLWKQKPRCKCVTDKVNKSIVDIFIGSYVAQLDGNNSVEEDYYDDDDELRHYYDPPASDDAANSLHKEEEAADAIAAQLR